MVHEGVSQVLKFLDDGVVEEEEKRPRPLSVVHDVIGV